jgi:hypothetical protein
MKLTKSILLIVTSLLFFGQTVVPLNISKSSSVTSFSVRSEVSHDAIKNEKEKKDIEEEQEEDIDDGSPPTSAADPGVESGVLSGIGITDEQLPWLIGLPAAAVLALILLNLRRKLKARRPQDSNK